MISLEQPPSRPRKLTSESNTGVFITIAMIGLWAISFVILLSLDITKFNFLMLLPIILWQTFLYTGLFITAHDAMHGVVFPKSTKINHKNFFAWYFHFMKGYWSWTQIISLMIIYNVVHSTLHIPKDNLTYFWVIPSLVSSLQLFYFGTFLPHTEPVGGYSEPHRAQTISRPIWWSFVTCYHFGYHEEHHEYPHVSWWQLPEIYKMRTAEISGKS